MQEISDEELSTLRVILPCCSPLVESLVARIDRVEREKERLQGVVMQLHEDAATYKNALLITGCHDLFCAEYGRDCRKCGLARQAAKCAASMKQPQDIRRTCGNSD